MDPGDQFLLLDDFNTRRTDAMKLKDFLTKRGFTVSQEPQCARFSRMFTYPPIV